MRRASVLFVVALLCLIPGCVVGVGWLPDSSGFVFTTPKGRLALFDYATKKQRILLEDPAAATTCWPAVSPDGQKVALAHLGKQDGKNEAFLQIVLCDMKGKVEFRTEEFPFATLKGKDTAFSAQVTWSPDARNLVVHGQGFPNQGEGFDHAAVFAIAGRKLTVWPEHVPLYCSGTPIRPDGAGFLLATSCPKDDSVPQYYWADWSGKKQPIKMAIHGLLEHDPESWTALADSRWDGDRAILTFPSRRYVIDTNRLQETIEDLPAADTTIGKETVRVRARLASGVELLLLDRRYGKNSGTSTRVVARKKDDTALTEVVAPFRDRVALLNLSPDRKRAVVRVVHGYRGSKGDTIYVLNNDGRVHHTIDVYHEFVKK